MSLNCCPLQLTAMNQEFWNRCYKAAYALLSGSTVAVNTSEFPQLKYQSIVKEIQARISLLDGSASMPCKYTYDAKSSLLRIQLPR